MADAGTETVLRMVTSGLRGEGKPAMRQLAQAQGGEPQRIYRETLQVVFQAFVVHGDFESILVDVVNRDGDADSTGAIADMLAGSKYGAT